jgi:hypothetical protein
MGLTGGAKMRKLFGATLAILSMAVMGASTAQAAPITGTLNITGSVVVSATTIDWIPADGTTGVVFTVDPGTGYFTDIFNPAVNPPYFATAVDLGPGNPPPVAGFLDDFQESPEVASEYDDLSFTLSSVVAPSAPPCAGDGTDVGTCSFGFFTLTDTVNGVDVGFDINGFFVDPTYGDDGSLNSAIGLYTTQLDALAGFDTIQDVIEAIVTPGGSIRASYSAGITAVANEIPEPATLLTFGAGAAFLASRRRRNKKA